MCGKWAFSYGDNKHELVDRIIDDVSVIITILLVSSIVLGIVWR